MMHLLYAIAGLVVFAGGYFLGRSGGYKQGRFDEKFTARGK